MNFRPVPPSILLAFVLLSGLTPTQALAEDNLETFKSPTCPIEFAIPPGTHSEIPKDAWRTTVCAVDLLWDSPATGTSAIALHLKLYVGSLDEIADRAGFKRIGDEWVIPRRIKDGPYPVTEFKAHRYKGLRGLTGTKTKIVLYDPKTKTGALLNPKTLPDPESLALLESIRFLKP